MILLQNNKNSFILTNQEKQYTKSKQTFVYIIIIIYTLTFPKMKKLTKVAIKQIKFIVSNKEKKS